VYDAGRRRVLMTTDRSDPAVDCAGEATGARAAQTLGEPAAGALKRSAGAARSGPLSGGPANMLLPTAERPWNARALRLQVPAGLV